jgi:hypothetical protein
VKTLQTVTAVVEASAGLALMGFPSVTASLLLGVDLNSSAAVNLAHVGGAAILTLAIACWLARRDSDGVVSHGLVAAMAFYNIAVAGVLTIANFGDGLDGVLLWPAVAFHAAMSAWCVTNLLRRNEAAL